MGANLIGILWQPFPLQGQAPGQEEQRIDPPGSAWHGKEAPQQLQEGAAGGEATAKFGDRFCPVPGLVTLEQHRPAGQVQTPLLQGSAQVVIGPAITQLKQGYPARELGGEGKLAAEGAAAVVNESQRHRSILAIATPTP